MPDHLTASDPRTATDRAFPRDAPADVRLRFMLNHAVLAPNVLNSQPWSFAVEGSSVRLYADWSRQLLVTDPLGRALSVSCGAALMNLRLAANHYGYEAPSTLLPDPDDPDEFAWLWLGRTQPDTDSSLFDAIVHRRTERRAFTLEPVAAGVLATLREEAEQEGAHLFAFEGDDTATLAALVAEAVQAQGDAPEQRAELRGWLRSDHDPRPDGMPDAVQDSSGRRSGVRVSAETHPAAMRRLVAESPVVAVVTSLRDDPHGWLTAGQALQRVLLRATVLGLSASFLNPAVEVDAVRARIAGLVGDACPQVVLRIGYAASHGGTPRRRTSDVSS